MFKKLLKIMPLLMIAVVATAAASCSDKDEPIDPSKLPQKAQTFISTYYPSATIVTSKKDGNEYDVLLDEGTNIEFDKSGEWKDVDATVGMTIASGFYPAGIDAYVSANYPGTGINEISKEKHGYDVELLTGLDLRFNTAGEFLGIDRD